MAIVAGQEVLRKDVCGESTGVGGPCNQEQGHGGLETQPRNAR